MSTTTFTHGKHGRTDNHNTPEPDIYTIPNKTEKADKKKPPTQHTVITEDEYAVPNKTIALKKAATRQTELTKAEANGIDNSTYGETWTMNTGNTTVSTFTPPSKYDQEYYNTRPSHPSLAMTAMGDDGDYSSIGDQPITYATIDHGEAREDEEGEEEEEGYATVDYDRTPGGQNGDDGDDDDVSLQDNPLYD